jgi:hypothetical protein
VSVRRRAVKARLERNAAREISIAKFNKSLNALKRVVDNALAEGLKTLSDEEFARRLTEEQNE